MADGRSPFQLKLGQQYFRCHRCTQTKTLDGFYIPNKTRGNPDSVCKDCRRSDSRKNSRNRPEWRSREYEWKKRGILGKDVQPLKHPEFLEMLDYQGGRCAICEGEETCGNILVPDHEHPMGPMRGILCENCNRVLGHMRDSPSLLRRAANYLDSGSQTAPENRNQ